MSASALGHAQVDALATVAEELAKHEEYLKVQFARAICMIEQNTHLISLAFEGLG